MVYQSLEWICLSFLLLSALLGLALLARLKRFHWLAHENEEAQQTKNFLRIWGGVVLLSGLTLVLSLSFLSFFPPLSVFALGSIPTFLMSFLLYAFAQRWKSQSLQQKTSEGGIKIHAPSLEKGCGEPLKIVFRKIHSPMEPIEKKNRPDLYSVSIYPKALGSQWAPSPSWGEGWGEGLPQIENSFSLGIESSPHLFENRHFLFSSPSLWSPGGRYFYLREYLREENGASYEALVVVDTSGVREGTLHIVSWGRLKHCAWASPFELEYTVRSGSKEEYHSVDVRRSSVRWVPMVTHPNPT